MSLKHVRAIGTSTLLVVLTWHLAVTAQSPGRQPDAKRPKPGTKFHFEVIESFDAKYEGDTPGHIGRSGGLENARPNVALGDAVYHSEKRIGTVTNVNWSRAQDSLTIEFDPATGTRIAVGDVVWLDLNPAEE